MGDTVIRHASPSDLSALLSLYEELAGAKITAVPGDRASSKPLLTEILADPRRTLMVAVRDDQSPRASRSISMNSLKLQPAAAPRDRWCDPQAPTTASCSSL
jgi:hypothetical protein